MGGDFLSLPDSTHSQGRGLCSVPRQLLARNPPATRELESHIIAFDTKLISGSQDSRE